MASVYRIKGEGGVVIDSTTFLELPKAPQKTTTGVQREGMIRYNLGWSAFEGNIKFEDGSLAYRRFAMLDSNGRLLTSQLPDSITSGLDYIGTFSPLSDDIDPPMTPGVYTPLPIGTADNSGDYYIIRGIMDAAQAHYVANSPSTSTVVFIPDNPSGDGNWLQIKYYVTTNPNNTSTKIVSSAFARFNTAIPAGHVGLTSLATDPELTAPFTGTVDPSGETAMADGDWVILSNGKNQRIRNTRVSMLASSVLYSSSIISGSGRNVSNNGGTVQTIIDTLLLDGLRRTGDSMVNDGTMGKGRLAITYGTATEPSIAFNSGVYDPVTNPGTDPSKWTDTSTGIFRPAAGAISLSSSGVERLRQTPDQLILYPKLLTDPSVPNVLFSGLGNNQLGLSALNNTLYFVSDADTNVVFSKNASLFNGAVSVIGNTTLGTSSTNTLTVQASSTFNSANNRFVLGATFNSGSILSFEGTSTATVTKSTTSLNFNMASFDDITILDGSDIRTKFNRYGVQLPVLNPIDNAVGVDGMIAYSSQRNTVMQKSNGQWTTVSGGGVEQAFTVANWVLSGSNYTYTITGENIQSVRMQESVGANFNQVEVDSVIISPTNAVITVPATPDLRFAGRAIITYR